MFIKPELKIVSVEDTPELNLPHENWIPSVVRPGFGLNGRGSITLFDLLKAAVRQRPDYIIVGEVRGEEAYTLFQAIATGHLGMCTLHAESVEAVINRLESEPMNIPRPLIAMIDDIVIQVRTEVNGKPARRVSTVTEIVGIDPKTKEILAHEVYKWDPQSDSFVYSGKSYVLERHRERLGLTKKEIENEIEKRKAVLQWMVENNIRRYTEVAKVIREYYADPDRVYRKVRVGVK